MKAAMFNHFREQLQEAVQYRRARAHLPHIGLIVAGVMVCTIAYILLAILVAPPGARDYHFRNEDGAITALSAIFLSMASAFAIGALAVTIQRRDTGRWLWIIIALACGFLALDELLQFHERLGRVTERYLRPGLFKNWNDVVVIIYGVLALPVMVKLLPSGLRYRMFPELFGVAFLFYVVHTVIDSTHDPATAFTVICEESAKLICGAFLALGTFAGFLGGLWNEGRRSV